MTVKLYGFGRSRSFRCLWALHEAGVEHEFIAIDLFSSEANGSQSSDYLQINHQGKVPSLTHNDFTLTESAAIINYIDTLSDRSFIPTEPQARARYDELAYFILAELEQPLWNSGKHRFALPEEHRVPQILETANWEFAKAVKALGSLVTVEEFALGHAFSFADILLAQTFDWADRFKFEVPEKYLNYRDTMFARPAAIAALAAVS